MTMFTLFIHVAYYYPKVITSVEYGTDNATVYLEWTPESHNNIISYTVSAEPKVVVTLNSSPLSVQVTVQYNTLHNVSIVATSCGQYATITIIKLHYGKSSFDTLI